MRSDACAKRRGCESTGCEATRLRVASTWLHPQSRTICPAADQGAKSKRQIKAPNQSAKVARQIRAPNWRPRAMKAPQRRIGGTSPHATPLPCKSGAQTGTASALPRTIAPFRAASRGACGPASEPLLREGVLDRRAVLPHERETGTQSRGCVIMSVSASRVRIFSWRHAEPRTRTHPHAQRDAPARTRARRRTHKGARSSRVSKDHNGPTWH